MGSKITYILGAGASANAIPVVKDFNANVSTFIEVINKLECADVKYDSSSFNAGIPLTKKALKEKFVKDAQEMMQKINQNHSSIDNYARMLYLTRQIDELKKLKSLLQIYLLWIQFTKPYDKRYDLFLSTILNLKETSNELVLPNDINILSWNYDIQFEFAAQKYFKDDRLTYLQIVLHTTSNLKNLHELSKTDEFSIIRLNGDCYSWYEEEKPNNFNFETSEWKPQDESKIKEIIEEWLSFYFWFALAKGVRSIAGINYAWEENNHTKAVRKFANEKAIKTEILVVVGYSFPTFNRTIDRELISNMGNLKKVYIQTMKDFMPETVNRFKSLMGKIVDVIPVEMTSGKEEFYIPFEFVG